MKITKKELIAFINNNRQIMSETIKEARERWYENMEKETLFITTWQDNLQNFAIVLKEVLKRLNLNLSDIKLYYDAKKGERTRKGRKDIYILSHDNLLFNETFYATLSDLKTKKSKK